MSNVCYCMWFTLPRSASRYVRLQTSIFRHSSIHAYSKHKNKTKSGSISTDDVCS